MSNQNRLGAEPIPRLIFSMGLPAVAAQLVSVLYSTLDRIYLGNIPDIGHDVLTGVGVALPVMILITAVTFLIGVGGSTLAAMRLGEGDTPGAERVLGNAFFLILTLGGGLTVLFQLIRRPMLMAFGASDVTIAYADPYLGIYLWASIFMMITLGLNLFISAQGRPRTAMLSIIISSGVNMVLDPVFIFALNLGVRGAALATLLSQAAGAAWVLRALTSEKAPLRLRAHCLRPEGKTIKTILRLGIAPFAMMSTESLVSVTLNNTLQAYGGDLYVGSMTIMLSVMQVMMTPINGFTQGSQPVLSYNYGAKQPERVRQAFKLMLIVSLAISTAFCLTAVLFPGALARMFGKDAALLALTEKMMPIFLCGVFAVGAQVACQAAFIAMGQAGVSFLLALLRKVLLLIPLALILPRFFGVDGVFYAEPAADLLASAAAVTLFAVRFPRILRKKMEE